MILKEITDWSEYGVLISFVPYSGVMVVSKELTYWVNFDPKGQSVDFNGLKFIGVCFSPVLHAPPHSSWPL